MAIKFTELEIDLQWKWFLRPLQRDGVTVDDYYAQFCDWKEEMISASFPAKEEDYIEGFIENLKWDIRWRSSKYESSRIGLKTAYHNAQFEEYMMQLEAYSHHTHVVVNQAVESDPILVEAVSSIVDVSHCHNSYLNSETTDEQPDESLMVNDLPDSEEMLDFNGIQGNDSLNLEEMPGLEENKVSESGLKVLSIYCAHMAPKWKHVLDSQPIQGNVISVEVYFDQFYDWKKQLDAVSYIGDEQSYIDDFLWGLKRDLRMRVWGYKWKPRTLYGAFRRAEIEETMMKKDADMVFEEMPHPTSIHDQGTEDVSDEGSNVVLDASVGSEFTIKETLIGEDNKPSQLVLQKHVEQDEGKVVGGGIVPSLFDLQVSLGLLGDKTMNGSSKSSAKAWLERAASIVEFVLGKNAMKKDVAMEILFGEIVVFMFDPGIGYWPLKVINELLMKKIYTGKFNHFDIFLKMLVDYSSFALLIPICLTQNGRHFCDLVMSLSLFIDRSLWPVVSTKIHDTSQVIQKLMALYMLCLNVLLHGGNLHEIKFSTFSIVNNRIRGMEFSQITFIRYNVSDVFMILEILCQNDILLYILEDKEIFVRVAFHGFCEQKQLLTVVLQLFSFSHPRDVITTSVHIFIGWKVALEEVKGVFTGESLYSVQNTDKISTSANSIVVGNSKIYVIPAGLSIQRVPFDLAERALLSLVYTVLIEFLLLGRNNVGYQQRVTYKSSQLFDGFKPSQCRARRCSITEHLDVGLINKIGVPFVISVVHFDEMSCVTKYHSNVFYPGTKVYVAKRTAIEVHMNLQCIGAALAGILAHPVRCRPFDPVGNLLRQMEGNILKTDALSLVLVIIQIEVILILVGDMCQCALIDYILVDKDVLKWVGKRILALAMMASIIYEQTYGKCSFNKACKPLQQKLFLLAFFTNQKLFWLCYLVIVRTGGELSTFMAMLNCDVRSVGFDCEGIVDSMGFRRVDNDSSLHIAGKHLIKKDMDPSTLIGPDVVNIVVACVQALCWLATRLGDSTVSSFLNALFRKTLAFSTIELEHYIWDPGRKFHFEKAIVVISMINASSMGGDMHYVQAMFKQLGLSRGMWSC